MIYIQKGTTNNVVLTLSESSRISNPHFLFVFTNEFNKDSEPILFGCDDTSSYTNRYNLFQIVESDSGSTTGGFEVVLSLVTGQWKYQVYESTTQTLDIEETTGRVLEEGRMVVSGNEYVPVLGASTDSVYI